jgi:hypothetical protein
MKHVLASYLLLLQGYMSTFTTFTIVLIALIISVDGAIAQTMQSLVQLRVSPASARPKAMPNFVQFKISPVKVSQQDVGEMTWKAAYGVDETFIFSLKLDTQSNGLFTFSKGSIRHVQGSNSQDFLSKLTSTLGAKRVPKISKKVEVLNFDVAILGMHNTRFEDGGFSSQPIGNWITTKIFLANGEAEVFLNINPVSGIGEFSLKDTEYGDVVLRELASVL